MVSEFEKFMTVREYRIRQTILSPGARVAYVVYCLGCALGLVALGPQC